MSSRSVFPGLKPVNIGLTVFGHFQERLGRSRIVDIFREAAALFNAGAHVRNDIVGHAARTELAMRGSARKWNIGLLSPSSNADAAGPEITSALDPHHIANGDGSDDLVKLVLDVDTVAERDPALFLENFAGELPRLGGRQRHRRFQVWKLFAFYVGNVDVVAQMEIEPWHAWAMRRRGRSFRFLTWVAGLLDPARRQPDSELAATPDCRITRLDGAGTISFARSQVSFGGLVDAAHCDMVSAARAGLAKQD